MTQSPSADRAERSNDKGIDLTFAKVATIRYVLFK